MSELFYSASEAQLAEQEFERLGHPGKFTSVQLTEDDGQTDFTGSNYGGSSLIISGSWLGTIQLTDGGTIINASNVLTSGVLYDFSVQKVSGGAAGGGVFVFKRKGHY